MRLPFASPPLAESENAPKSDEEAEFDFGDDCYNDAATVTHEDRPKGLDAATAAGFVAGAGRHDLSCAMAWREENAMTMAGLAGSFPTAAIAVQGEKKKKTEQQREMLALELTRRPVRHPMTAAGNVDLMGDLHSSGGERVSTIGGNGPPRRLELCHFKETATQKAQRHYKRKRELNERARQIAQGHWGRWEEQKKQEGQSRRDP